MSEAINQKGLEEVSKVDNELQTMSKELDKLGTFILTNYPGEPGRTGKNESAVDVAIRLLSEQE